MRPVEIETFLEYHFLSSPAFSPDGAWAAFLDRQADLEKNGYRCDLWVLRLADKSCRRLTWDGGTRHFAWDGDSRLVVARPAPKDPHGTVLSVLDPETAREEAPVLLPVKVLQLTPLGDGRFAALAEYRVPGKAVDPDAPYHVFEELPFRWNAQGLVNGVRKRIYLWDPQKTGEEALTAVTGEDFYVGNLTTSPWRLSAEGDWLLFLGQEMSGGVQKQYPGLYGWRLSTGELRRYIPEDTMKVEAGQILPGTTKAIVTATDGAEYGACQMPEFHTLDLETGALSPLCRYELSIGAAITTDSALGAGITNKAFGDSLYFITMDGGSSYLRRIDQEGKLSEYLTPEGSCASFDICPGHLLWLGMHGGLRELYLDGEQVTRMNDELLAGLTLSVPEPLESRRPGGETVQGWVLPPAGYQPGKKYPGILNIHGGPRAAFGPTYFHEMQVWASAGYFVFYCNPHGSDGRGNAFGDMRGLYGTIDYEDLMAFTDAVLAAWPDIDPDRLGVTGGSYGGFMTNWVVGNTTRFAAAASQRSISNWVSKCMTTDIGYYFNMDQIKADPWSSADKMWTHSPLKYANMAKTPTLFIQSDEDYRCWMGDAIQMFSALKYFGVEARLCLFHGENHELSRSGKPTHRIRRMTEMMNWFDKYLK